MKVENYVLAEMSVDAIEKLSRLLFAAWNFVLKLEKLCHSISLNHFSQIIRFMISCLENVHLKHWLTDYTSKQQIGFSVTVAKCNSACVFFYFVYLNVDFFERMVFWIVDFSMSEHSLFYISFVTSCFRQNVRIVIYIMLHFILLSTWYSSENLFCLFFSFFFSFVLI